MSAEVRGPQDGDLLPHGGGDVHQLRRGQGVWNSYLGENVYLKFLANLKVNKVPDK